MPNRTLCALFASSQVVVASRWAGDALLVDDHLSVLAAVILLKDDAARVEKGPRKRVDLIVLGDKIRSGQKLGDLDLFKIGFPLPMWPEG